MLPNIQKKDKMIPISEPVLGEEEIEYVCNCLRSNMLSFLGEYVKTFERKFSKFSGCKYGVSCSNGTTALHLALLAVGIKPGDEVIVPNLTFIATANAVRYCNAVPVFADSEPLTWNIEPNEIRKKITAKTKAIIAVHLYGHPCEMDDIVKIAKEHNLFLIEDCAEAHGAEYKGKRVGSVGDIGTFSFYPNKVITTGEGGMCTTNNKDFFDRMIYFRNHCASKKKYWFDDVGYNYRLTNIQAAIGVAQLNKVDLFLKIKRNNAKVYSNLLRKIKGVTLPTEKSYAKHIYWMYSILLGDSYKLKRDELIKKLMQKGVESRPVFYLLTDMPPYKSKEKFPVAREISRRGISLPSGVSLKESEINKVVGLIKKFSK